MKYRLCGRILAVVTLMNFSVSRGYGDQSITRTPNFEGSGMRQYSELEVDTLIENLTGAAEEAIEQAAAEAARAATLALLDREAAALAEARKWRDQYGKTRRRGIMVAVITGVICFTGGIAVGNVLIAGGK
jgi:hypothetical protein